MKKEIIHKDRVRKHFDRWASYYDRGHITKWLQKLQLETIKIMSPKPSDHVLDVGSGTGWAVVHLSRMLSDGRACGIDISSAMIQKAITKTKGLKNVEFKVGDAENIQYDNEEFDSVICTISFHHYPKPGVALREFWRVLKPGGHAYILDVCRDESLLVYIFDLAHKVFRGDHVRYYHTEEIKEFFIKAGFNDIVERFRVKRLFWRKKFLTSVVLFSGRK